MADKSIKGITLNAYAQQKAREKELASISKNVAQHLCGYGLNIKELRKVMDLAESIILSSTTVNYKSSSS